MRPRYGRRRRGGVRIKGNLRSRAVDASTLGVAALLEQHSKHRLSGTREALQGASLQQIAQRVLLTAEYQASVALTVGEDAAPGVKSGLGEKSERERDAPVGVDGQLYGGSGHS